MQRLEPHELRAWKALINAHATAVERIEARLSEAELPPLGWYDVLWTLYKAEGRRLRPHELAREVVVSRSWLSRLSERLVREGLIEREQCPSDRRGMFLVLTDDGAKMLRRMWPVLEPAIRDHFVAHLQCPTTLAEILEPIARPAETAAVPAS